MIKAIEKKMMEQNAHAVKYVPAVGIKDAIGIVKDINMQIERDFGLAGPLTLSSSNAMIHATRWANARESYIVETNVKRRDKEIVAAAIAQINKCPYCEDAHVTSIRSIGDHDTFKAISNNTWQSLSDVRTKAIIEWSMNTRNPKAEIIASPPFSREEAPEIIGTALVFHSTNRLVSIFLEDSPLPSFLNNTFMKKMALNIASKTLFKSMVMKTPKGGDSLEFIEDFSATTFENWTAPVPFYHHANAVRLSLIDQLEKDHIPNSCLDVFMVVLNNWQGEEMPLGKGWVNKAVASLGVSDKAIASIMLLSAFAPYTITRMDVNNFKTIANPNMLGVCYWSIQMVTNKIGAWITAPFN